MIELVRIIQDQAALYSYRATRHENRAEQLDLMIETTKPKLPYSEWHTLIATPFRYSPPLLNARFRPPYGKNVFYGSLVEETALYEHAFHFMKERMHLNIETETGSRTIFFVNADDCNSFHVKQDNNFLSIVNKHDYSASHQFVSANPHISFIFYPSCRDPQQRDNATVLDINHLGKNPTWEVSIKFFYDNTHKQITWLDYQLSIQWMQVA